MRYNSYGVTDKFEQSIKKSGRGSVTQRQEAASANIVHPTLEHSYSVSLSGHLSVTDLSVCLSVCLYSVRASISTYKSGTLMQGMARLVVCTLQQSFFAKHLLLYINTCKGHIVGGCSVYKTVESFDDYIIKIVAADFFKQILGP